VPGCRNAIFLDLHHREWRLDGGGNTLVNLITLCGAHHHAVHLGKLFVESTPGGLRFFHPDGTPYGSSLCPANPQARAKAESALKIMGFAAKEVKLALARIPPNSSASLERLVRQALAELG
jgi:hypothetical protein